MLFNSLSHLVDYTSFWLRSLGANSIGQFILSTTSAFIDLAGIIPTTEIIKIILTVYPLKLLVLSTLIIPTAILASIIKKKEKINVFDFKINYNPFSFK